MARQGKQTRTAARPAGGAQAQAPDAQPQGEPEGEAPSRKAEVMKRCCFLMTMLVFVAVLVLVNWLCYRLVALLLPRSLALFAVIGAYYLLARRVIQYFAFPGSFQLSSRKLEFQYAQRMANEMGKSLNSFRNMMQFFVMTLNYAGSSQADAPLICDNEKTFQFIYECSRMKKMVKQFTGQVDRLKARQNHMIFEGSGAKGANFDEQRQVELQKEAQQCHPIYEDQLVLYEALKSIKVRMQNTVVWFSGEQHTLWKIGDVQDMLAAPEGLSLDPGSILQFTNSGAELHSKLEKLTQVTQQAEDLVYEVACELPTWRAQFRREMSCRSLGTLTQMSAEMEIQFQSETQFLVTEDGDQIQVYWLPAAKRFEQRHGMEIVAGNTMIICNPNMAFAEVSQYSSEWPEFYLGFGINVVLWNYRGYGRSTGTPSPTNNRNDAELVFQWARQQTLLHVADRKPIRIGAHGISIGGLAATHLGRIGAVDFLMVDRTFSDLQNIPKQVSPLLPHILKIITMWDSPDNSRDYLFTNCYKVIAQDPKDEVIDDVASLKTGVSLSILKNELDNRHLQRAILGSSLNSQRSINIAQYYHILNKSETEILFSSLETIFFQIFELEIENRAVRRRFCMVSGPENAQAPDSSGATTQRVLSSRQRRNKKHEDEYSSSFVSPGEKNVMALTDFMNGDSFVENYEPMQTERDGADDEAKDLAPSPGRDTSIMMDESMYQDGALNTSLLDESMASSRSLNASPATSPRKRAIDEENKANSNNKVKLTNDLGQVRLTTKMRLKEKELRRFCSMQRNRPLRQSEKQRMISDFVKYIDTLIQIYRLSEKLDAAGDTLSRIFEMSTEDPGKRYRQKYLENFRNWIVNFDIWGSFLPLSSQSWDVHVARAAAYEKLSIFRASLRDIMKQHQLSKGSNTRSRIQESVILTSLMTQVSMLEFYVAKIESYLRRKHESILKVNDLEETSNGDLSDSQGEDHSTRVSLMSSAHNVDLEKQSSSQSDPSQNDQPRAEKRIFEYKEQEQISQRTQAQDDDDLDEQHRKSDTSEDSLCKQDNVKPTEADSRSQSDVDGAELDADLEFYDQIQQIQASGTSGQGNRSDLAQAANLKSSIEFKDFLEPHLIKTGHIIPLSNGHCGAFSKTELTLFEIHLTNAGFIQDWQALAPPSSSEALNRTGEPMDDEEQLVDQELLSD